jgi:methionyl-tRNA formyltransferase
MFKAVVFAYSEVGVRCLAALIEQQVKVLLVVTHVDSPTENMWFGSVANLAREHGIEVAKPADPNTEEFVRRVAALAPDYIFSFYYREILSDALLACARWGALNMHGSLLPKYRGSACVNWAILNGETETGATLHYMVRKIDAGPIVAQEAVPIGIDDTAIIVSKAIAATAARLLVHALPTLASGPPAGRPMNLAAGTYFRSRTPADGRLDLSWPAARIHALIRAVAPPFPGAFIDLDSERLIFAGSRWCGQKSAHQELAPCLYVEDGQLYLDCCDALRLQITGLTLNATPLDAQAFRRRYGDTALTLGNSSVRKET